MKKLLTIISLSAMTLFFNACAPAYVATEPVYVEGVRPPRPGNTQIWIDGDWMWNRQTRIYERREGYWSLPNRGRAFVPGYWRTNRRGSYWRNGYWH